MLSTFKKACVLVAWMAFPAIPALMQDAYTSPFNMGGTGRLNPDPYEWDASTWSMMLGPLLGFGFLAGATWGIGDEAGRSRWRSWMGRRSIWVGLGPWIGFLTAAAVFFAVLAADRLIQSILGRPIEYPTLPKSWALEALVLVIMAWYALGWLVLAVAALRRARRSGRAMSAFRLGLAMALGFIATLFAAYWMITSWDKAYYFDPKIRP